MNEDRVPTQSLDDTLRAWGLDPASFIESLTGWGYEIRRSEQPVERLLRDLVAEVGAEPIRDNFARAIGAWIRARNYIEAQDARLGSPRGE